MFTSEVYSYFGEVARTIKMLLLIFVITLGYFSQLTDACSAGEADGVGVELLGTTYDCKYLRTFYPEDRHVGIYENRKTYCKQRNTDCCETCTNILNCKDDPVNGIYLAEIYFNCSFLLSYHPADEKVGIYENRKTICRQPTTKCCESCEKVLAEKDIPSTVWSSTPTSKPTHAQMSTTSPTPKQYIDTCENNCLWIADGSMGPCSWLLDKSRPEYKIRHSLCSTARGCAGTCHKISMENVSQAANERATTPPVCADSFIMEGKLSYACYHLLKPDSTIYNRRHALCLSDSKSCCVTCRQVENEKPSVIVKYSDQNMIAKNNGVNKVLPESSKSSSNPEPKPGADTSLPGLLTFFQNLKANVENMQMQREKQMNAFQLMIKNIISFVKQKNP